MRAPENGFASDQRNATTNSSPRDCKAIRESAQLTPPDGDASDTDDCPLMLKFKQKTGGDITSPSKAPPALCDLFQNSPSFKVNDLVERDKPREAASEFSSEALISCVRAATLALHEPDSPASSSSGLHATRRRSRDLENRGNMTPSPNRSPQLAQYSKANSPFSKVPTIERKVIEIDIEDTPPPKEEEIKEEERAPDLRKTLPINLQKWNSLLTMASIPSLATLQEHVPS